MSALAERTRKEAEKKDMIPHDKTGFRKGMGTIDNIYVLNYVMNRQLTRKERKLMALFIDLKGAFDIIGREVLIEAMREREREGKG